MLFLIMNVQLLLVFVIIFQTAAVDDLESKDFSDSAICGVVKEGNRIYGGQITALGEFPWLAAVEYVSRYDEITEIGCIGSLINNRYILTTAGCTTNTEFEPIRIWLGEWKISTDPDCVELIANLECADPVQKIKIKDKIPHPYFSRESLHNDIGLFRLENEVQFTEYISPICLPSPHLPLPELGTRMTVAGWGRTENDSSSDVQLKVEVPLVSNDVCFQKIEGTRRIPLHQLCAGGEMGKDSCNGDVGGPLMRIYDDKAKNQMHWYLYGIVSGGIQCGRKGYPAIYTRVSSYTNWIAKVISEE